MTSSYDEIYSLFLGKITDYKITSLNPSDAYAIMGDYLKAVAGDPATRKLFSSIVFDDEVMTIKYELVRSVDEYYDKRYVTNLFATGMAVEWVRTQYLTVKNTAMMIGNKDGKWYSQANHMTELKSMFDGLSSEYSKMTGKHGYSFFVMNGERS